MKINDDNDTSIMSRLLIFTQLPQLNASLKDHQTSSTLNASEPYEIAETIIISIFGGLLCLLTIIGNVMVMISIKMDKQLQTISNYFLLSLSIADFLIGSFSMPLFVVYNVFERWPLGTFICDTWLAIDYLISNASVLNLLIISFDRYFSVTRPLTYRARRTTRRACVMIATTWIISLLLWPPWIFSWPYIEGKRTVPDDKCYIQFFETNSYVTFGTALAAFYIPLTVMIILYWRVWRETEKRYRDLTTLFLVSAMGSKPEPNCNKGRNVVMLSRENTFSSDSTKTHISRESKNEGRFNLNKFSSINWGFWRRSYIQPKEIEISQQNDMSPIATSTSTIKTENIKSSDSLYTIVIQIFGEEESNPQIKILELNDKEKTNCQDNRTNRIKEPECSVSSSNMSTKKYAPSNSFHPQQPKSERKAAKTLSAILLAFAITWTPYNVLVLIKTLTASGQESNTISPILWDFAYYLCYINSTLNPLCYALCNASFRRTYIRILKCKWSSAANNHRRQKHWNLELSQQINTINKAR